MNPSLRSQSVSNKQNSFLKKSVISITIDPQKAQDLRNRLIDRGISPMPLPSVKRPKISNPPVTKAKLPSITVFDDKTPDVSFIKIDQKPSNPSASKPRQEKQVEERMTSGVISVGKLRPSTAAKRKLSKREHESSFVSLSRPITSQQNILPHKPSFSNNFSTDENIRAMNLLHKMQGSRKVIQHYIPQNPSFVQEEVFEEFKQEPAEKLSEIDLFIKSLQEDKKELGFIYCLENQAHNPYDLKKIVSPQGHSEYYTISKKGIALFVNGSPVEFTRLSD